MSAEQLTTATPDPIVLVARQWDERGWIGGAHYTASLSVLRVAELINDSDQKILKPHGLTPARHEVLALLYFSRAGELPLGKLGQRLMVHPTSMTITIDALERLSFVERTPHPVDRRATLARITAAGREAVEVTSKAMAQARSGLSALSDRQAHIIFTTLRHVRAAAGDIKATMDDGPFDPIEEATRHWSDHGWKPGNHFRASLSIIRTSELIAESHEPVLKPFGLTPSRHEALAWLYFSRTGELTPSRLGQRLMIRPASVTSTIDTLERLSFVERTPHPADRRATLARITAAGREAVEVTSARMAAAQSGLAVLSVRQAHTLFTTLRHVRIAAGDFVPR